MMTNTVCLLFGGEGPERDVSRHSAAAIYSALLAQYPCVLPILIDSVGIWRLFYGARAEELLSVSEADPRLIPISLAHRSIIPSNTQKPLPNPIVFPAMHGSYAEDGRLQGLLDSLHIPYVGCGVETSVLAMNKALLGDLLQKHGIPMVGRISTKITSDAELPVFLQKAESRFPYPMFVKPARSGSSIGAGPAYHRNELVQRIKAAAQIDPTVLIERFIAGREIELAVFQDRELIISPPGEIKHGTDFYDYEIKYSAGPAELQIPAELPHYTQEMLTTLAGRIFNLLGCRHLARIDFFVSFGGDIWFNEINTLPGFTETSMYPQLMAEAGLPLPALLSRLLASAEVS